MAKPQFFCLSPIKGLSSPHFDYRPAFGWKVELEPGLVWRTVDRRDLELFDRFWNFFGDGIAVWERKELRGADTWLVREATDKADLQTFPGQVVSFAVARDTQRTSRSPDAVHDLREQH